MQLSYRRARLEDLDPANVLVVGAINQLAQSHGYPPIASLRPPLFQIFSLSHDPEGLWVAEENGKLVGFAFAWTAGSLWFLSQLFISPETQGKGIGDTLLKLTLDHAEKAGAKARALITFAFNPVSQGLYMRHGLMPRHLIYACSVKRDVLQSGLSGSFLKHRPIDASHLEDLARIDMAALGTRRDHHHSFLLEGSTKGVLFENEGRLAGYAYVTAEGGIGPLAVIDPSAMAPALKTALAIGLEGGADTVSVFISGATEEAVRVMTTHGLRIALPTLMMSDVQFGDPRLYLPRNPGFM
jgi:GNAT superfamily N-acetyltransferase